MARINSRYNFAPPDHFKDEIDISRSLFNLLDSHGGLWMICWIKKRFVIVEDI